MENSTLRPEVLAERLSGFALSLYFRMQEYPLTDTVLRLGTHGFHILYILENSPDGKTPMTELVTRLHRTRQQLSKLISDLEDDGLVTRIHTKENRRLVYVTLTEQGRRVTGYAHKAMTTAVSDALSHLPSEKLGEIGTCTGQLSKLAEYINTYLQEVSNERS